MSTVTINGSAMGTAFQQMLTAADIEPGAELSYQTAKLIYTYHPLGAKLAEKPIQIAQSQTREISVPDSPEARVKEAFEQQWQKDGVDKHIFNTAVLSRVYGISSVALMIEGVAPNQPVDFAKLYQQRISFNVYDPLNTAGSLVLNQDPLAMDFLHTAEIRVNGATFHRSRSCVQMNEFPIYISYTSSAFGFVGRSVYQRTLYPLKSFIQSMVTDDLVTTKAGVLVAMMKQPGSIIDNLMIKMFAQKRAMLKEARTGNVLSIDKDEKIESLNLQNLDGASKNARQNILENIASGAGMPAKMITDETFAEGFGEGTEDAKSVARYVDKVRVDLQPLYDFFDKITRHRAWNPDFYATIQAEFPEYKDVPYETAFYKWSNSFIAQWPSLLTEPDSEKVKVDDVKLKACIALLQVLLPEMDPENKARVIEWAQDNFNDLKMLFQNPLDIDIQDFLDYQPDEADGLDLDDDADADDKPVKAPRPFSAADSAARAINVDRAVAALTQAIERLPKQGERRLVVAK